jgi:hypothetical protein
VEKGKDKIPSTTPPPDSLQNVSTFRRDPVAGKPRQAWWLDVANPTWGDMKTLGRVNSLRRLLFAPANSSNSCRVLPKARLLSHHLSCD